MCLPRWVEIHNCSRQRSLQDINSCTITIRTLQKGDVKTWTLAFKFSSQTCYGGAWSQRVDGVCKCVCKDGFTYIDQGWGYSGECRPDCWPDCGSPSPSPSPSGHCKKAIVQFQTYTFYFSSQKCFDGAWSKRVDGVCKCVCQDGFTYHDVGFGVSGKCRRNCWPDCGSPSPSPSPSGSCKKVIVQFQTCSFQFSSQKCYGGAWSKSVDGVCKCVCWANDLKYVDGVGCEPTGSPSPSPPGECKKVKCWFSL